MIVIIKRFFILSFSLLLLSNAFAGDTDLYSDHCPLGCPKAETDMAIVVHSPYISGINKSNLWTLWTAYKVSPDSFGKRINAKFKADPLLPNHLQKKPSAYKGLYKAYKLDRGHMAPASSFSVNKDTAKQTYYLSNINPQPSRLNRGLWAKIEKWERNNAPLYVMAGVIHNNANKQNHPTGNFWKIILNGNKKYFHSLIFVKNGNKYCYKNIEINKLEKLTKLSFFKNLP
ncbi:MAG: DNA/RNA non-specific endonuclease, partial [Alphaproteobacteria bacterium]